MFSPHSCRSVLTNKALEMNFDICEVLKNACWRIAKSFFEYFQKDIVCSESIYLTIMLKP